MNLEITQRLRCLQFKLRTNKMMQEREFGIFVRSVGVKILKFCSTAMRCRGRNAAVSSSGIQIVLLDIKGGIRNVSQSGRLTHFLSSFTATPSSLQRWLCKLSRREPRRRRLTVLWSDRRPERARLAGARQTGIHQC